MHFIKKIDNILTKFLEIMVIILLAISTTSIFIQVIFRYFLRMPILWTEELARYLLIWLAFLGSVLGIKNNAHLNIEIFLRIVKGKVKQLLNIMRCTIQIAFLIALIKGGLEIIPKLGKFKSPMLQIPMNWVYISLVIGGGLMIYETIFSFFLEKDKHLNQESLQEVE